MQQNFFASVAQDQLKRANDQHINDPSAKRPVGDEKGLDGDELGDENGSGRRSIFKECMHRNSDHDDEELENSEDDHGPDAMQRTVVYSPQSCEDQQKNMNLLSTAAR